MLRIPSLAKFVVLMSFATGAFAQATCTLTCPANITQSNDPDQCGAIVNYPAPTTGANDQCGTIVCAPTSGSFFPVTLASPTVVTCTAAGFPGSPSCTFTVDVNDTQAPTIGTMQDLTFTIAENQTTRVVTYPSPTVSDNCPGVTVNLVPPSGSTFSIGQTQVTATATDTSGNAASTAFLVTLLASIRIPAMSELGLVLLALMLMGAAAYRQYRRR